MVEEMLEEAPTLEARALFEWLCEQHAGRYRPGQLRTFQRRVATWRALHQEKVAILEQVHRPGEVMQTDGTWLNDLGVMIQGEPFEHILIHSVLTHSNWEWGRIAPGSYRAGVSGSPSSGSSKCFGEAGTRSSVPPEG